MMELLGLVLGTLRVACRGRHALLLENLVLRQQLAVLLRTNRPRLERRDKVFWVLVRWLTSGWRRILVFVGPDTVVRWHRQGGASSGAGSRGRGSIGRTFRRECLDHVLVVNEVHLCALLDEFREYYIRERPHRTLRSALPVPTARAPTGTIRSRPVLGGLHHRYDRVA